MPKDLSIDQSRLTNVPMDDVALNSVANTLSSLASSAQDAEQTELAACCLTLKKLSRIATMTKEQDLGLDPGAICDFVSDALCAVEQFCVDGSQAEVTLLVSIQADAQRNWGEYLPLIADEDVAYNTADESSLDSSRARETNECGPDSRDEIPLPADQIALIIGSLETDNTDGPMVAGPTLAEPSISRATGNKLNGLDSNQAIPSAIPEFQPSRADLDHETMEAFIDDAARCTASIERSVLDYEENPHDRSPLKQVCRELHTLKGASASVRLTNLAEYLHRVEDLLEDCFKHDGSIEPEVVLGCVDAVRQQLDAISSPNSPNEASDTELVKIESSDEGTIRVRTQQLNRLLDMLAELVMLRNRRHSKTESLKTVATELMQCVSRIRIHQERFSTLVSQVDVASVPEGSEYSLTEVANDLFELARGIREAYDPIVDENRLLSRFVRQFRGELMELRRVPISGLFQRVQRAAREAAKAEQKRVQFEFTGKHVAAERALLEKLYEPLLHIVRNAVSHGIESRQQRTALGKSETGIVQINASTNGNVLTVEICDDGSGLDFDALRKRGLERGLLSANRNATEDELAQLIFTPDFSTRDTVNEVSGRGIGMDVVASTLTELQGWVEVESVRGQGTRMSVMIPRGSFIDHAMVIKVGGQFFAVPTQFVLPNQQSNMTDATLPTIDLASVVAPGRKPPPNLETESIVIQANAITDGPGAGHSARSTDRCVQLTVDSVVGSEEVVIRPLPGMLRAQNLFSGVTLAGSGEVMLIFDCNSLIERGGQTEATRPAVNETRNPNLPSILVVDDSVSSRRVLAEQLSGILPVDIEQASSGDEAIRLLRSREFDAVFTDLDMPHMTGFELLSEMQRDEALKTIPTTVVSSRNDDRSKNQAKQSGAIGYLLKPPTESDLRRIVEQLPLA